MEKLSYAVLERQEFDKYLLKDAPERVLQFGEGNFLRAFVEYFIDIMNEKTDFCGKVVLVKPTASTSGLVKKINEQEGLYTLLLRGQENGRQINYKRVISCVSRCLDPYADYKSLLDCAKNPALRFLISNTTEAGITFDPACKIDDTPPSSFPGKLTAFLYERWRLGLPGFVILPCELIDHNGDELKRCVEKYIRLWRMEEAFSKWVDTENSFCSTLVDRIVTGYPQDEAADICRGLGYADDLLDSGEVFGSWVIEGPQSIKVEFPAEEAGLPVVIVDDYMPYKQRKVRILNGAHTAMALGAYLAGANIVRSCMEDEVIHGFLRKCVYEEILPTLDLSGKDLTDFAAAVAERFCNPYIDHALLSISMNSTAKWKTRVMPSLLEYVRRRGRLPKGLTFSFAAYIAFYHTGFQRNADCLLGRRGEEIYEIKDDPWVLDFYDAHSGDSAIEIAAAVIGNDQMWGGALAKLEGFADAVAQDLSCIEEKGMYQAMKECLT